MDPLADSYSFWSNYAYAGNDPINNIDQDGLGPTPGNVASLAANVAKNGGTNVIKTLLKNGSWSVTWISKDGAAICHIFKNAASAGTATVKIITQAVSVADRLVKLETVKPVGDREKGKPVGLNLGWLKQPKESYDGKNWLSFNPNNTKQATFANNVVVSAYNQAISTVETGSKAFSARGRGQLFISFIKSLLSVGQFVNESKEEEMEDIKDAATVDNAENLLGAILLNKVVMGSFEIGEAPTNCFVAGTKVLTKNGLVNIEDIKVGDSVWAYSDSLHGNNIEIVQQKIVSHTEQLVGLTIGTETIKATPEHPFYINNRWKVAKNVVVGDSVFLFNGNKQVVLRVFYKDTAATVYNFKVSDYHTYYVSALGILVHNTCVDNLKLLHSEETIIRSADYQKIKSLTDKELIESVTHPTKYDPVRVNTNGTVIDGNTRVYEIRRRGLKVDVPVENYDPDNSWFVH